MGKIHSLETFGTVDGPGIRLVIFMQGCPMRCLFCHNPDTWALDGKDMTIDDLILQVHKYDNYYKNGGGVTLSGGEPLMQIDFVIELFERLKQENIHTCLDTSGVTFSRNPDVIQKFDRLIKVTDLVLLDIKHIDNQSHKKLTAHTNENILDFARYLSDNKVPVWIRYVLVPTINSDEKSLRELRQFLDSLDTIENIEILPYHTMGVDKYKSLGLGYKLKDINPPTQEQIDIASKILKG